MSMPVCIKGRIYIPADIHEAEVRALKQRHLESLRCEYLYMELIGLTAAGSRVRAERDRLESELKEQADD